MCVKQTFLIPISSAPDKETLLYPCKELDLRRHGGMCPLMRPQSSRGSWRSDQEAPSRYGPEFSLETNMLDTHLENNIAAESILSSADQ